MLLRKYINDSEQSHGLPLGIVDSIGRRDMLLRKYINDSEQSHGLPLGIVDSIGRRDMLLRKYIPSKAMDCPLDC